MGDFDDDTAARVAAAVRAGERRAADVAQEHLDRIAAHDEEIHAFNTVLADEALARAAEIDERVAAGEDPGRLAGVPVALKDNMCTRGIETNCSSKILQGWRPPYDATIVTKLSKHIVAPTLRDVALKVTTRKVEAEGHLRRPGRDYRSQESTGDNT